jgi:hypothetical protein
MRLDSVVGVLTLTLAAALAALGVRLLALARRTGKLPELLVGLFFGIVGPAGWLFLGAQSAEAADLHQRRLGAFGLCGITVACSLLYIFTYWTFARGKRAALILTVGGIALLWAGFAVEVNGTVFLEEIEPRLSFVMPRLLCFGWSTYEGVRCYSMMRRRLRFNLADAVVTNRLLLYATWTGALTVMPLLKTVVRLLVLAGVATGWRTPFLVIIRVGALVGLVAMFLNFYPPPAYLRWIQGGQPDRAS